MEHSLLYYIGAAFVGGIILNAMPCVLPVLTMKVFHLIEHADDEPHVTRKHGIAYTMGIMTTFWGLAAVIIALRAAGTKMGWGMQFQNPIFVAALTALMVAAGLNALGVFEINIGMGGDQEASGYSASFFNGIFASIMSTPCSAPFLGFAAAFALGSGAQWWQTLLMFSFIGLGLAAPFLLVSFVPAVSKILPRPGAWMETFKQVMGFTLLGAAVWLFGALQSQIGHDRGSDFLAFLVVLGICFWAIGRFGAIHFETGRRVLVHGIAAALAIGGGFVFINLQRDLKKDHVVAETPQEQQNDDRPAVKGGKINWADFSPPGVQASLDRGQPVFMDYTADWCLNCKSNEKLFIEVDQIRKDFTDTKILPMKADFTNEDEEIEKWMSKLGREAIPIYVIYYPDGTHDLLPESITTGMLSDALNKAAKKYPATQYRPAPKAKAVPAPTNVAPTKVAAEAG